MAYSADRTPQELTALTALASDDTIIVGDTSDVSEVAKSITKANLITTLGITTPPVDSVNGATGAVVLDADDISDAATTNKFVTAADVTVLGNTSGTNTGDQTSIVGITGTTAEFNTALSDGSFATGGGTATGTNTGDQTSIVGITGTKAQYDTSVTDGNFMYIGDAPTAHTHLLAAGATDVTATAAEVNILDGVTATTAEINKLDGVAGDVVGTTDTQTLTNKTLTDAKVIGAINAQTGTTYTLVLADASKHVTMSNASANTLTVPPNSSVAFETGTRLMVQQLGAGATTIAAGAGVTINAPTTVTLAIGEQYESRGLIKTGTDTWQLI